MLIPILFAFLFHQTAPTSVEAPKAEVQIELFQKPYAYGRPVRFRLLLTNLGKTPFYVSKDFGEAGGGTAGFYFEKQQLSGKRPKIGCGVAGDRWLTEKRSADQILREDYVLLWTGMSVGSVFTMTGCQGPLARGKYRVSAEYSAQDWNIQVVSEMPGLKFPVLTGRVKAEPVVLTIK